MSAGSRSAPRTHRGAGLIALLALAPACGEVEALELPPVAASAPVPAPKPRAPAELTTRGELATQAEHYERARREITPEHFDEELERLKREIVVDRPAKGRSKRR